MLLYIDLQMPKWLYDLPIIKTLKAKQMAHYNCLWQFLTASTRRTCSMVRFILKSSGSRIKQAGVLHARRYDAQTKIHQLQHDYVVCLKGSCPLDEYTGTLIFGIPDNQKKNLPSHMLQVQADQEVFSAYEEFNVYHTIMQNSRKMT